MLAVANGLNIIAKDFEKRRERICTNLKLLENLPKRRIVKTG